MTVLLVFSNAIKLLIFPIPIFHLKPLNLFLKYTPSDQLVGLNSISFSSSIMKLSTIALSILAPLSVWAAGSATDIEEEIVESKISKFSADPEFKGFSKSDVPLLINGVELPVTFEFSNNESHPLQVMTFAGAFTYEDQAAPYANLSTVKIGPIHVGAEGRSNFTTNLKVDLPPHDFLLNFTFLVANNEGSLEPYTTKAVKISVSDAPISVFDIRFLVAQAFLAVTVIGLGYIAYIVFGATYLEEKKPAVKKHVVDEPKTSGVVVNEKGYDESWIPQHHLNGGKKTKKTKGN